MEGNPSVQEQHDPVTWFKKCQLQAVIRNNVVPEWFHGIISRNRAEELLRSKPPGYFLIRVSESRIGYTLSYRDLCSNEDRIRHFMIDVLENGHYIISGENRSHQSLQDLVDFHRKMPVMPFRQVLTVACGQSLNDTVDYTELVFHQVKAATQTSSPTVEKIPRDDPPPAVPYRPADLCSPEELSSKTQANKLYPNLTDSHIHFSPPPPPTPDPKTRNMFAAGDPPVKQPFADSSAPERPNTCIRATSAFPSFGSSATESSCAANAHPSKNPEGKQSVINLKNLKKKFLKKKISLGTNVVTETNERVVETENLYKELQDRSVFRESHPPVSADVKQSDNELPEEYKPPSSFAPGY